jgi:RNA polymerase sigma-70 factor (ECF subfamily)
VANGGPTSRALGETTPATLLAEVDDVSDAPEPVGQAPQYAFESYDDLMRRAIADPNAFGTFYERTVDEILQFFRRRVFDPDLSNDLTAETYAQLLRNVRKFDASRGSARQYLYGVAKNQYLLWQRKGVVSSRHRHALGMIEVPLSESGEDHTVDRLDAVRMRQRLSRAMAALTAHERDAISLRVIDALAYRDIAVTLGCTEVAARVRVSRGLAKLAAILDVEAQPRS